MSVFRGIRTTRSLGPHPLPGGRKLTASSVMSVPIMAKSPDSISKMSGHLAPPAHGRGCPLEPSRRVNILRNVTIVTSLVNANLRYAESMSESKLREAVCIQVAKLVREKRIEQGLSMTELADRAGLSRAMISFVERDIRNPTLETLLRISSVLKVELADLIREATSRAKTKIR